jgi:acetyltransferase-like isoleucine patch superfamily enzyme
MLAREDEVRIARRTAESRAMVADTMRAMGLTAALNRLSFEEGDEIRRQFAALTHQALDARFRLIPPFFTTCGQNLRIGRNVFINQNCTIYDLAPVSIGDDVLIGPNVSLITDGHPVAPSQRTAYVVARPITVERGVWIATGAIVIGGVTIGENSVVAAGSVVTKDVPANTLVGGNPARVIRSIEGE